jgi:hypothetical protein
MKVIFTAPKKLGNRVYKKGDQIVPDSLAHNLAFRELVKSGVIQMVPRDAATQKIQSSRDMKAQEHAKSPRMARQAAKAHLSAPRLVQASPQPAQPISEGVAEAAPTAPKGD